MVHGDVLNKLRRYCAYQERCHEEVRTKLLSLKIYGNDLEEVINTLIEENFLNEERFARSFAGGKFRVKKWGKQKILRELKLRKISDYCIRKAMEEIPDDDYDKTLRSLIAASMKKYAGDPFVQRSKTANYCIARGFEHDRVWEIIYHDHPHKK